MTFSIVIPTYNGSDYIEETIKSVLNQTRQPDEIIVSDDNSKDNTLDICQKYSGRVKIYRNENGPSGFVNGWNNAIAHAQGEFISILHQDDILAPTFLEEAERALALHPYIKHFFVPCNYIDENGRIKRIADYCDGKTHLMTGKEYVDAYIHLGTPHVHRCPGVITHRDIFDVCRYRAEAGHIADDDFFFRVGNYTDVLGIYKPLADYREHSRSETGHLDVIQITKRLLKDMDFQFHNSKSNKCFSRKNRIHYLIWKYRYIVRLVVYAVKERQHKEIGYALKYLPL